MKLVTQFVCVLLVMAACKTNPGFDTKSQLAPNDVMRVAREGVRGANERLSIWRDGRRYLEGETEPFTGLAFTYWNNGQTCTEEYYRNGVPDGIEVFRDQDGRKTGEIRYVDGKQNGEWREWYSNGRLEHVWRYKDGKQDGLQEGWYQNGQKQYEWLKVGDKFHGTQIGWYQNGQMDYQRNMANDVREGGWKCWHKNGRLSSQGTFAGGKRTGVFLEWHDNGVQSFQTEYKNGERLDRFMQWDKRGNNVSDAIYLLRDKHMELIKHAVLIRLIGECEVILEDPADVAKVISALQLEPIGPLAPRELCGCIIAGYAQFIARDGQSLSISGNKYEFDVFIGKAVTAYLPMAGFEEVVRSYTKKPSVARSTGASSLPMPKTSTDSRPTP